jgi:hypothetical protein
MLRLISLFNINQSNLSRLRLISWEPYFIGFLFTLEGGRWHITCIYLVILPYLVISLEGKLVETLLTILGGVYLFILDLVDPSLCKKLICSLMYLVNTRHDICFVVNALSQFMVEPM